MRFLALRNKHTRARVYYGGRSRREPAPVIIPLEKNDGRYVLDFIRGVWRLRPAGEDKNRFEQRPKRRHVEMHGDVVPRLPTSPTASLMASSPLRHYDRGKAVYRWPLATRARRESGSQVVIFRWISCPTDATRRSRARALWEYTRAYSVLRLFSIRNGQGRGRYEGGSLYVRCDWAIDFKSILLRTCFRKCDPRRIKKFLLGKLWITIISQDFGIF